MNKHKYFALLCLFLTVCLMETRGNNARDDLKKGAEKDVIIELKNKSDKPIVIEEGLPFYIEYTIEGYLFGLQEITMHEVIPGFATPQQLNVETLSKCPTPNITNENDARIRYCTTTLYRVLPTSTGSYKLPPLQVLVENEAGKIITYTGQSIDIEVIPANHSFLTTVKDWKQTKHKTQATDVFIHPQDWFINTTLSKDTIYQGQAVEERYELYTLLKPLGKLNYSIEKKGSFDKSREVYYYPQDELKADRIAQIDSIDYHVAHIRSMVYFPDISGSLQTMTMQYYMPFELPLDESKGETIKDKQVLVDDIVTPGQRIVVIPLPSNAPEGFDGLIGKYKVGVFAEKPNKEIHVGDTLTIRVEVAGGGNIQIEQNKFFDIALPPAFEVLDRNVRCDLESIYSEGFMGWHYVVYKVVAQKEGKHEIESNELVFFYPQEKEYAKLKPEKITLEVKKRSDE